MQLQWLPKQTLGKKVNLITNLVKKKKLVGSWQDPIPVLQIALPTKIVPSCARLLSWDLTLEEMRQENSSRRFVFKHFFSCPSCYGQGIWGVMSARPKSSAGLQVPWSLVSLKCDPTAKGALLAIQLIHMYTNQLDC